MQGEVSLGATHQTGESVFEEVQNQLHDEPFTSLRMDDIMFWLRQLLFRRE